MEVKASFFARETDDPTPGNRETCYLCSHVSSKGLLTVNLTSASRNWLLFPYFVVLSIHELELQ